METEYLTIEQARQFVQKCENEGIFIFGIERFICFDEGNMPDLDGIADFSSILTQNVSESSSAAFGFLALFGSDPRERFKLVY